MTYTDFLGKPIQAGDKIIHAIKIGSSPRLEHATVQEIVPLISDPYGRVGHANLIREDQIDKDEPTRYWANGAPEKRYIVKAVKPHWTGKGTTTVTITKVDNVVVV